MDLVSPNYVAFIFGAAAVFHVCPARWRHAYLSAVSLAFYCLFSVISAAVMVVFAILTWRAAREIDRLQGAKAASAVMWSVVVLLVSYLAVLKAVPLYGLAAAPPSVSRFLSGFGASYYTFKLLGYLIDVYWRKQAPLRLAELMSIASFFPQLPAGPIQRASEFRLAPAHEVPEMMSEGLRRILLGLVKKMAIADPLGAMVALIAGNAHEYRAQLWVLFYLYPVQLYADFSALTDIAVGAARLFGVRSPENFALPFFAPNISEYWRRWHMSLTRWLTDYLFMPLRMSTRRLGQLGLVISVTVNMVLIGLWHGFTMGFFLFGVIHAAFLTTDALTRTYREDLQDRRPGLARYSAVTGPILTYHLVAFALVFFRDGTFDGSVYAIRHVVDGLTQLPGSLSGLMHTFGRFRSLSAFLGLSALLLIDAGAWIRSAGWTWASRVPAFASLPRPLRWACYYAVIALAIILHRQSTQFIYIQF